MKQTALYNQHTSLKAKMVPFANYSMPIQYDSVKEEVIAVRENVGIFDVSHMGEFEVKGDKAVEFVDYLLTNDFSGAGEFKAVYSPLCNEEGNILDDLIAYKVASNKVLICVNASNKEKDWKWIEAQSKKFDVSLTDQSEETSLLAIQGPRSEKLLTDLGIPLPNDFSYYSAREIDFKGRSITVARTGYTGEDGFEIFCDHETANQLWQDSLKHGAKPCGLAARDVLRLEVCYPLYGNELTEEITPLDAGLKWTIKMEKPNFVGKKSLENYKSDKRLVKISLDKGIPRSGYKVLDSTGQQIGIITSGGMSIMLNKGIALALITRDKFPENKEFVVEIRSKNYKANYHTKPFYNGGHK